ncbi:hypothetical protein APS56_08645 [Pseudalgibacter alginicilyticus]|uniref:Uncharacterized protein n=1 Tax=Pseudalgibacter alginicilyticus TaxID=1736674 RepID=A0A0P0D2N5_9FLAO|nr:hypothetical protein [Pseudalgibacter alginicilyticus]ALJ05187.1 hypothetical protein APS56_08645 [Pseudalgibacter alginicilyticus]
MLAKKFPKNNEEAKNFGGFLVNANQFCRSFESKTSLKTTIDEVNLFLLSNGFEPIHYESFDIELGYDKNGVSLSKHGYLEELVLFILKK